MSQRCGRRCHASLIFSLAIARFFFVDLSQKVRQAEFESRSDMLGKIPKIDGIFLVSRVV
jgi:hypothetical protein